jgi:hypothetical protein
MIFSLIKIISPYIIYDYLWLLVAILLMAIGGYFINGYWCLLYYYLLLAILLMANGGYYINGY